MSLHTTWVDVIDRITGDYEDHLITGLAHYITIYTDYYTHVFFVYLLVVCAQLDLRHGTPFVTLSIYCALLSNSTVKLCVSCFAACRCLLLCSACLCSCAFVNGHGRPLLDTKRKSQETLRAFFAENEIMCGTDTVFC